MKIVTDALNVMIVTDALNVMIVTDALNVMIFTDALNVMIVTDALNVMILKVRNRNMISYGDILRELRKSKKISQRELSRRTGIACSTISRIEGNIIIPRVDTYTNLIQELKR